MTKYVVPGACAVYLGYRVYDLPQKAQTNVEMAKENIRMLQWKRRQHNRRFQHWEHDDYDYEKQLNALLFEQYEWLYNSNWVHKTFDGPPTVDLKQ